MAQVRVSKTVQAPIQLVFDAWLHPDLIAIPSPSPSHVTIEVEALGTTETECTVTQELAPGWESFVDKAKGSWALMLESLRKNILNQQG